MTPMDDELRAVLHGHAQHVVPVPDLMPGIERRARAIQRRRRALAVAGSALSVLLVALALPGVAPSMRFWPTGGGPAGGSGVVEGAAGPMFRQPADAAGPPDAAGSADRVESADRAGPQHRVASRPSNYLDWTYRTDRPAPAALTAAGRADLARALRVEPARLVTDELWTGRVPDSAEWLYAVQGWPEGAPEATFAVYRAPPGGGDPVAVYRSPVALQGAEVAVVSVPLDARWLLVLPAPEVSRVGYAAPGDSGFEPYRADGEPVLIPRGAGAGVPELVQAVDAAGRVLTPPDAAAHRRAQVAGDKVLSGWGLGRS
jgi:hypothetical protein